MPYKINGKFVSKEKFDAHEASTREEENTVVETNNNVEDFEEATESTGRVYATGPRATTVYKRAANKRTQAEVTLIKAKAKLDAFDSGRDDLIAAVDAAEVAFSDAQDEVEEAAQGLA